MLNLGAKIRKIRQLICHAQPQMPSNPMSMQKRKKRKEIDTDEKERNDTLHQSYYYKLINYWYNKGNDTVYIALNKYKYTLLCSGIHWITDYPTLQEIKTNMSLKVFTVYPIFGIKLKEMYLSCC